MIHGPIGKHGTPVDEATGDRTEDARIVGADTVVAHYKITVLRDAHRAKIAQVLVLRRDIRLGDNFPVNVDGALADFDGFTGQTNNALDERFRVVERIPEDNHVAAVNGLEAVDKFVDEDALLVGEERRHAGAFDFDRLVQEDNDDEGEADGD